MAGGVGGGGERGTYACYRAPEVGAAASILGASRVGCLGERYELGEELGWGQFGLIRSCTDRSTGCAAACKSIAKDRLASPADLRLEIDVMARLSAHPGVVALRAAYEDHLHVHLVMELCAGGELFHRLQRRGRFPEPQAASLFRDLMAVVAYLHDHGIVHRDLKPENILLADDSDSSPIKLADFGLATFIQPGQSLQGTVGSPFYIAPEVLVGGYNEAADIWSAGVILYILLSGAAPFWGKTKLMIFDAVRLAELQFPDDPWVHVSESARCLVSGMLSRDPRKRLTAKQVLDHSWIKECAQQSPRHHDSLSVPAFEQGAGSCSYSTPITSMCRDVSFSSSGTPVTCDSHLHHSLASSDCRSSYRSSYFSSLVEPTSCAPATGFSFQSVSMLPSMPSFTFFSPPPSANLQENMLAFTTVLSNVGSPERDSSFRDIFASREAPAFRSSKDTELKLGEVRPGPVSTSRITEFHNRRNHTIGLGEIEQLDFVVSESIIRWASCTHLPSTPSLWPSLVC